MKSSSKLIIFALSLLALTARTFAQETSPREQLQQLTAQLQQTPNDTAMRERIIKLALEITPAPAVPPDAKRPFVMAGTYQKEAKKPSDFALAIDAYQDALKIAPSWGDAYYNLSVALESVGRLDEARDALRLYLLTKPNDAEEAQNRLYALDAKKNIAAKQAAEAAAEKAQADKVAAAKKTEEEDIKALIPGTAYLISTDGSEVTDTKTGLIWRRCAEGMVCSAGTCSGEALELSYEGALQRAKSEASRNGKAWRVPEAHELAGVVDKSRNPMINHTAFPAQPCTDGSYGCCSFRSATRSAKHPTHLVVRFRAADGADSTSDTAFDK